MILDLAPSAYRIDQFLPLRSRDKSMLDLDVYISDPLQDVESDPMRYSDKGALIDVRYKTSDRSKDRLEDIVGASTHPAHDGGFAALYLMTLQ